VASNGSMDKAISNSISELTAIHSTTKLYRKRGLDFVFLPMPMIAYQDDGGLEYRIHIEHSKNLKPLVESSLVESIGVDLNTSVLSACTDRQLRSIVDNVLLPLFSEGSVKGLSIACNPFTSSRASTVLNCIQDLNSAVLPNDSRSRIRTVATETLRGHSVRPGHLVTGRTFRPAHRMTIDSRTSSSSEDGADYPLRKRQLDLIDRCVSSNHTRSGTKVVI